MSNTGFKGLDVRQTGSALVFRASLKDSAGAKVTSGAASLYLFELQSDGTLKSYDFNDNTFKTTALTTPTASMTHRTGNNGTYSTGVWTYALGTLTGFTVGAVYLAQISNSSASPTEQEREFQYGAEQGDLVVTAGSTGQAYLQTDLTEIKGQAVTCAAPVTVGAFVGNAAAALSVDASGRVDLGKILGTASAGAVGYVGIDWGHVNAPTTAVNLSGTTISTSQAVASVSGAVGSVTGNVGGNVVGSVAGDVQGKVLGGGASAFTAVGVQADAQKWSGASTVLDGNNLPKVCVSDWNGSAVGNLPANFSSFSIDGSGYVGLSRWGGTSVGVVPPDATFTRSGTAQAGGASSITLDSGASSTNNLYQNAVVVIRSGTGAGQSAIISGYNGTTKVATVNGTWATAPDNTSAFTLVAFGAISASVSGNVTVGGYSAGQDPATYVLATPANKLAADTSGRVNVGKWLDQAVSLDSNNLPNVNVKDWNQVAVGAMPQNFSQLLISGVGHISTVDTVANVVPLPAVDGKTFQQAMQYVAAMVAGKLPSGAGSGTEAYVGLDGITTRVTMTIDGSGNRTAVTYN